MLIVHITIIIGIYAPVEGKKRLKEISVMNFKTYLIKLVKIIQLQFMVILMQEWEIQ